MNISVVITITNIITTIITIAIIIIIITINTILLLLLPLLAIIIIHRRQTPTIRKLPPAAREQMKALEEAAPSLL